MTARILAPMVDLHAHLLPGIDDGPDSIVSSLALARAAVASGTRVMACTPHIDHTWGIDPTQVPGLVERMRAELTDAGIQLEIVAGGEHAPTRAAELDDDALRSVALGKGSWLLLESPRRDPGRLLETVIFDLRTRGFHVLLAHPERSPIFQHDYERLMALVRSGVCCSITGSALTGSFGGVPRKLALRMLADEIVHDVASDAHDAARRRPDLGPARDVVGRVAGGGVNKARWMCDALPEAIVAGAALPQAPAADRPRARQGLLARLRR